MHIAIKNISKCIPEDECTHLYEFLWTFTTISRKYLNSDTMVVIHGFLFESQLEAASNLCLIQVLAEL